MGEFLKSIGGKIVTGITSLVVVAAGVAWWQTDASIKHHLLSVSGRLIGWMMLVLAVPWAGFALIGWINRRDSNAAGAALVLAFTAIEAVLLAWMFSWSVRGGTEWVLYAAAVLIAGVYNLFICDWIAELTE